MNKFDRYYKNGIVALPKSVQYYVCIGDYEYDKMPIEEKLLDLAGTEPMVSYPSALKGKTHAVLLRTVMLLTVILLGIALCNC